MLVVVALRARLGWLGMLVPVTLVVPVVVLGRVKSMHVIRIATHIFVYFDRISKLTFFGIFRIFRKCDSKPLQAELSIKNSVYSGGGVEVFYF